jgi:hypothetical protein
VNCTKVVAAAGAVRAEHCSAFKLTEVAAGITKLELTCSLNLRGSIPQAFTNEVAVPGQCTRSAPPERLPAPPAHVHSSAALAASLGATTAAVERARYL